MEIKLKNIGINVWQVERLPQMKAEGVGYAKEEMLQHVQEDLSLEQLVQSASLPQLISPVVAMPDVHEGFGLPIGGVMATNGLVSSGAVGMDINCGVRFFYSQLKYDAKLFSPETLRLLINRIQREVAVGLGQRRREATPSFLFRDIIYHGAQALIKKGYGEKEDAESIEENGRMAGADLN